MFKALFRPVLWTLLATALYAGAAIAIFAADENKNMAARQVDNMAVGTVKIKP